MRNNGLEETQAGIKIARKNINNLRYADDTTLMAESEGELKSLLMKMKAGIQTTWIESQKMCLFSPTAITKYCRMAGLNNRNLLSHSSGAMP